MLLVWWVAAAAPCAWPTCAWADWPSFTTVVTGTDSVVFPIEAAIRNTPATSTYGEVWITYGLQHWSNPLVTPELNWVEVFLRGYRCQLGILGGTCASSTTGALVEVGTDVWGPHLAHVGLAIRKVGTNPIDFTVTRRAKVFVDCDGDGLQGGPPSYDIQDQNGADLVAYTFTNPGNLGAFTSTGSKTVSPNTAGVCGDRGMTSVRYHSGDTWACYTHTPLIGPGALDVVSCNSTVGATGTAWVDEFDIIPPLIGVEDHPSLDFIDADRIVATSHRNEANPNQDEIRIHFPDHVGGNPTIFVGGSTWSNHPILDVHWSQVVPGTGVVQLVWHRGQGLNAELMYSSCDLDKNANPPVLCDAGNQWALPVPLASGHDEKYPHIVSDQGYTLIVYTALDAAGLNRVYAIDRCGGGSWSPPASVRTNADPVHQSMAFGRPGLVLNEGGNIAHLVMLDGLTAPSTDDPNNTNANLYWYRKSYTCAL